MLIGGEPKLVETVFPGDLDKITDIPIHESSRIETVLRETDKLCEERSDKSEENSTQKEEIAVIMSESIEKMAVDEGEDDNMKETVDLGTLKMENSALMRDLIMAQAKLDSKDNDLKE